MDFSFDKALSEITTYKLHPGFLPFIGDKFEKYRVLHVGESHYIDSDKYDIDYFKKWWTEPCPEVEEEFAGWFTRLVVNNYINNSTGDTIFNNFLKSFCKAVMGEEIIITPETKKRYEYLAFMNFFQMPSLYYGKSFWKSLEKAAKNIGNRDLLNIMWNEACKNAVYTLDSVIDIIKPRAVVITSIDAGNAYKIHGGKYNDLIIFTSHPAYPFSWNKNLSSLGGRKGIEICETELKKRFS